ncbi:MAG: hypothetical protein K9K64_06880 [Desulfohalobiaceae bacterium]|nr:hypothetical protein [Desulfohalobiaceae bacterium]
MAFRLVGIGGLGLMLSPSAKHLAKGETARFIRIHDRGTMDQRRDRCRQAWKEHGAELVGDYQDLIGDGDFDGVVVCAGKNGDDLEIFRSIVPLIKKRCSESPFILHLSTVSSGFAEAAQAFLAEEGLEYANYPLTGGPAGAEAGTMLILASGDPGLYERLEPALSLMGKPKFFGERVTAGAEVKLIGQLMVFNGLNGICSAAALKSACFQEPLTGADQADFFDFLNGGAGGTRQWDVALSKAVRDDVWDQGFMLQHAVVDAIYAARLCQEKGLSALTSMPMISTGLAFSHLLNKYPGTPLATHAVVREMLKENAAGIDSLLQEGMDYANPGASLKKCIASLPEKIRKTVCLDVDQEDFKN